MNNQYEQEVMFGVKMTEVVAFLRDLDEGDMVDLMMELALSTGAEKIIDVKLAAQTVLDGLKDIEEVA